MEKPKKCPGGDVLLAGPKLPTGHRPFVRHQADCTVVSGIMRPVREGEALHGNRFYLEKQGDSEVYKVQDVAVPEPVTGKGPTKVTTEKFRSGWDRIFGDVDTPEA